MCWWESSHVEEPDELDIRVAAFHLTGALSTLTGKQRFVIELRYGLRDGTCYTQDEIAYHMGVQQSTVCEIERHALSRLRGF